MTPVHPLRKLAFPLVIIYGFAVLFFIFKLNPLLFSEDLLSSEITSDPSASAMTFPAPPEKVDPWQGSPFDLPPHFRAPQSSRIYHKVRTGQLFDISGLKISDIPLNWKIIGEEISIVQKNRFILSNLSGQILWSFSAETNNSNNDLYQPAYSETLVFIASKNGKLYALNKLTGVLKWMTSFKTTISFGPVLSTKGLYVGLGSPTKFVKVHPATGKKMWTGKSAIEIKGQKFAIHKRLKYLFLNANDKILAINLKDGKEVWSSETQGEVTGTSIVVGDHLFITNSEGQVLAFDVQKGSKVWEYNMEEVASSDLTYIPEYDQIAVASRDTYIHLISRKNGERKWKYKTSNESSTSELRAVRMSNQSIEALELSWARKGWTLWSPCGSKKICVFNPSNSQVVARFFLRGELEAMPQFSGNSFFVALRSPKPMPELPDQPTLKQTEWALAKMIKLKSKPVSTPPVPSPDSQ